MKKWIELNLKNYLNRKLIAIIVSIIILMTMLQFKTLQTSSAGAFNWLMNTGINVFEDVLTLIIFTYILFTRGGGVYTTNWAGKIITQLN